MNKTAYLLCALTFGALFVPGLDAAEGASRMRNDFSCTSTTNRCTCKGISDCDAMEDRVCGTNTPVCDANGCTCDWSKPPKAVTRPVTKPTAGGKPPLMKAAPQ